jgi:DNA-binding PadR family transcriptional regulator
MPLAVCATPIGNLDDVTLRVLAELRDADTVLCEDTRHTRVLLDRHAIRARLVSYHEHNEAARTAEVLPRLVAGGFATARRVRQQRRPDKLVYRLTKRGERAFRDWLEEPVDERAGVRSPFLLKIFFGAKMSREALVAHVERKRDEAAAELAEYREIERVIRDDEASYFGYVTLRWGLAQAEAWIGWADEILRELAAR